MDIFTLINNILLSYMVIFKVAVFFFIVAAILEMLNKIGVFGKKNKNFCLVDKKQIFNTDTKCEIFYPLIKTFIASPIVIYAYSLICIYIPKDYSFNLFTKYLNDIPFILQIFIALFILDICLYVRHRFSHQFMWSFHAVHHCAHKISWLTMMRVHPIDYVVMNLIQIVILSLIGTSIEIFAIAHIINGFWNAFVHSNIHLDFPKPIKYIIAGPNFHRWHHATDEAAHNKNYCIMFSCIDYVMGTYYWPDDILPQKYGSSMKSLDDYQNTNIVKELLYPIKRQIRKVKSLAIKK